MTSDPILSDNILELEEKISFYKRQSGKNLWLLGRVLLHIKERELYRQRSPFWRSYCEEVIKIALPTADRLIRLSKVYEEKVLEEWGVGKLNLLLSVDEAERSRFLSSHAPIISYRDLEEEISPMKEEKYIRDDEKEYKKKQLAEDDKYFFVEVLTKQEELLLEISRIKIKKVTCFDFMDACKLRKTFNESKLKDRIFQNHHRIIKELGELGG